jgi:hypothetical protein
VIEVTAGRQEDRAFLIVELAKVTTLVDRE